MARKKPACLLESFGKLVYNFIMKIEDDPKYKDLITKYGDDLVSVTDGDETFFYHKEKHIATLTMSCKSGQVGISFEFIDDWDKKRNN